MTQKEYRALQRQNDKRRNPGKYKVVFDNTTAKRLVAENCRECAGFIFLVTIPNRKEIALVKMSRESVNRYAAEIFNRPDVVYSSEDAAQKRDESGKPCLRINEKVLRKDIDTLGERVNVGMTWEHFRKHLQTLDKTHNAGNGFEAFCSKHYGWKRIGNADRQSHTRHNDLLDNEGRQWECKIAKSGYITSQYWTADHKWG